MTVFFCAAAQPRNASNTAMPTPSWYRISLFEVLGYAQTLRAVMRTRAMAYEYRKFYIDGQWGEPAQPEEFKVINPATEEVAGVISMGSVADVDRAVAAARRAFDSFSQPMADVFF